MVALFKAVEKRVSDLYAEDYPHLLNLSVQDRLKNTTFRLFRLHDDLQGNRQDIVDTVVSTLNAMGSDLTTMITAYGITHDVVGFETNVVYMRCMGKLCKAAEELDHLGAFEYRNVFEQNLTEIFTLVSDIPKAPLTTTEDIVNDIRERLYGSLGIPFDLLGNPDHVFPQNVVDDYKRQFKREVPDNKND